MARRRVESVVSEHDVLTAIIQHITNGDLREAIECAKDLRRQVDRGIHTNPSSSRLYEPFKIVGAIAEDVEAIQYQHAKNGKLYEHEFNGDVNILAIMRHGKKEMLIVSTRGLPLWDSFPDDR